MTNYYEQLVQRLREQYMDTKQMLPNVLCHDSADAITKLSAERDALRAQCYAECAAICRKAEDWSDGSLGWNRACKRMAIAIEHALAEGKP